MWSWFLASRVLCLLLLVPESGVLSDITYFALKLPDLGPAAALPEYPWAAVALLYVPLQWGLPPGAPYYLSLLALFLAVDAAFAWLLWREGGRRMTHGIMLWLAVGPLLGPLLLTRFDALAAALAAAALLACARARAATSGGLVALGCAVKLFPVIGVPALLVPGGTRERLKTLAGIGMAGIALAGLTVALAGFDRLWSPLAFQAERGLQVEAFAALPLLWARHFSPETWETVLATCRCWELEGPGVGAAMKIASGALVAGALGMLFLHVRAFRAPPAARNAALAARLTVLFLILWVSTNKVFSPQYVLWIAAPMAVLGALEDLPRIDLALIAAACVLTQVIFPINYPALAHADQSQFWVLAVLTLRDLALLALGVRVTMRVWRETAHG